MKYLYTLILITTLLIVLPAQISANQIEIEADELLVRSGPGTAYEPIGHVNSGDVFEALGTDGEWVNLTFQNESGWVHQDYVRAFDGETTDTEPSDEGDTTNEGSDDEITSEDTLIFPMQQTINQMTLHLREEPRLGSTILTHLKKNDNITLLALEEGWYHVETDDDVGYLKANVLDTAQNMQQGQSPLLNKTIVIDPGHGGVDVGAISIDNQYESYFTMITSYVLKHRLEQLGAIVHLTRNDDYFYGLTPRATLSNFVEADVFLSIHYNSEPSFPTANGINTFYRRSTYRELADTVHDAIIEHSGANDRGVESGNYSVLRNNLRPGLLLELGFLSNAEEEEKISEFSYHETLVRGIINGLEIYFD